MYSTKLTVSHSICSELTPPPKEKNTTLGCLFVRLFFSPFFFSVCYIQKALLLIKQSKVHSAHPPVPTMYNPNVSIQLPSPANSTLDFNILKKTKQKRGMGTLRKFTVVFFFFLLSFFPVRVSGVVTTSRKNKNPTLHSVPSGFIKRCNVGKILYLVNFKACQDYEPHRHYTIILGHKGLLHSLARGWNHSVTSCKQKMKKEKKKKILFG